jgi:Fur family peroxide stress response transcriptional regulator
VEDIFHDLSYQIPSLSKTTIYNTVHTFVETGLVRLISIDGFDARIDLTTENHGHFKCDRCGSIFNFAINIDSVPVDELRHFQIKAKNVYFNGICPNCLNKIKDRED